MGEIEGEEGRVEEKRRKRVVEAGKWVGYGLVENGVEEGKG